MMTSICLEIQQNPFWQLLFSVVLAPTQPPSAAAPTTMTAITSSAGIMMTQLVNEFEFCSV